MSSELLTAARISATIPRSISASDLVARSAARAARKPSSSIRTSVISIASSSEISRTRAPRLCWNSTSPCTDSSWRADLSTNLDVPNRSHKSTSTRRCRGAYSPLSIASRSACVTVVFGSSGIASPRAYGRGAVSVERPDRRQAPRLAFGPIGLRPGNRRPVRREYQPRARVAQLDAVASRLVDVQEERLLNGVLVRPGLDEHARVEADVRRPEHVLPGVGREGDVMQPPARTGPVVGVHEVVGLLGEVRPLGRNRAVIEHDLLGYPPAEH